MLPPQREELPEPARPAIRSVLDGRRFEQKLGDGDNHC